MGDPRKIRRKYETPTHPWQKQRIEEEKKLFHEYGLKNKKELWRMETFLKKFKDQVKALASRVDKQSKLEEKQLIDRLVSLKLVSKSDSLDAVLGLGIMDVLNRRLQTILVKKGLARSMEQSRQFITHGHVLVNNKKVTFPSFMVTEKEESLIEFVPTSSLSKEDHPERIIKEVSKDKIDKKKVEKKEEAPPAFAPDEIKEIEEKGVVEKKIEKKVEKIEVSVKEKVKAEGAKEIKEESKKESKDKVESEEEK
ncbi:MAG: 30S ribosomal protein S4 [Nanoarchaeota archaeon]|nr:30S ribosomal protein S4 [Nanoarchaeota archaeon]MBU1321959.1 30S ribosomal protein S4 [Nanoarchaeota archaeon]MBU1597955.1 30S ribosomal protein S4 [Nanoarchaeota archaeon]MBU2441192.1 30S ribosomal protein S4 [Nanoarchaeota archaeon]